MSPSVPNAAVLRHGKMVFVGLFMAMCNVTSVEIVGFASLKGLDNHFIGLRVEVLLAK